MKRLLCRSLLAVLAVSVLGLVGCGRSTDFDARWASFKRDMESISKSVDYHLFNYDWDDPYLP